MDIWKVSMLTGERNCMDLPITVEQIIEWEKGELIQNIMSHLNDEQREFLMTGITPLEWSQHFGGNDD